MKKNLTTGSVLKTVLYFSMPYILSYFLQTLYGMADLFIIGQFNGVESTTAVSIGSQVMHMLTVMIVGLAMGATVMIGQAVGAAKREQASHAIGNTVTLFMALSVILTVGLLLAVKPIVNVMSTPAEAVPGTVSYLTICFIGIPFITAYNIISSIFRGMGDSKSPMYFIAVACATNIALDYLFIGGLGLGPAGAALGTTLSQTISVIVSLAVILKRKMITLTENDFKPDRTTMAGLLKIGIPIALQDGFIQIAFIVITVFANKRGLNDAAAVGIVEKIIAILFLVPSSMLQTVSALSAQNIGAGKHGRARLTLRYASIMAVIWGIGVCILMQFDAEPFVGLFAKDSAEVVRLGSQYMRGYVWDAILAGVHFSFSGYFCAYGLSGISFLHNSLSIICVRIPLSYFASKYFTGTLFPMGLASPAGSALSVIICICVFLWLNRQQKVIKQECKQMERKELFQIGDVAKMFHISVGTLRHYEKIGLLQPEYIDNKTGYRYYSTRQFECLNTIRYLRVLDMPLPRIKDFLKNKDINKIQKMLQEQKETVIRRQRDLQIIERKISNRLQQLEDALISELDTIKIVQTEARRIAWIRNNLSINSYLDLETSIRQLEKQQKDAVVFLGKVGVGIAKEQLQKKQYGSYDMVFLILDKEDSYHGITEELPEETCVTVRFCGSHKEAPLYYRKLDSFISDHKLSITGFSKEITMIDYGITNDTSQFVTEIQVPVTAG